MSFIISSIILATAAHAAVHLPPSVNTTQLLGLVNDTSFNPALYRDGGGGGMTGSGIHVVGFSDTATYGGANGKVATYQSNATGDPTINGSVWTSFVHNTFAVMNATQPTSLHDFGNNRSTAVGTFPKPVLGAANAYETALGANFIIWPNNNMLGSDEVTHLASDQLVGVFTVSSNNGHKNITALYTTLATISVAEDLPTGKVLQATRNVTSLFFANETMMFGWGTYAHHSSHQNGKYLYLFDKKTTSKSSALRIARVPQKEMTNRTSYTFWNGTHWLSTMPETSDTESEIFTYSSGFDVGDLFYSAYFKAPILVFSSGFSYYMAVANSHDLTQGFSDPVKIYTPKWLPGTTLIYSFHAYPHLDSTGKTLTLTWAESTTLIRAAKVTFN